MKNGNYTLTDGWGNYFYITLNKEGKSTFYDPKTDSSNPDYAYDQAISFIQFFINDLESEVSLDGEIISPYGKEGLA